MTAPRTAEVWTTRRLLQWIGEAFTARGLDSPRLQAEMLVGHVLGCERLKLYTDPDRPASPLERQALRDLVARALNHEPIQYLVGHAWFFGLRFKADRRALIPRPSTETIVEHVLQHARSAPGFGGAKGEGVLLADVCTGTGCIALSLLHNLTQARAIATDLSADALDLAQDNAQLLSLSDRVELVRGNLLDPLFEHPVTRAEGSLHYLVSNPPYIPDHEWPEVEPNVKDHEPHEALRGGADGLDLVRPIISSAARFLRPGGLLLVEVAASHSAQAHEIAASAAGLMDPVVLKDHEGLPRVVMARRAE